MNSWNPKWANEIQDGAVNRSIAKYHAEHPERVQTCATPSTLLECPRVVWLRYKKNLPPPIPLTWGKAQRMLHGRVFEDTIAMQLKASGELLWHWRDTFEGESTKFEMGEGETLVKGTPDLLLKINDKVAISDAKTSMGKSFGYVPLHPDEAFKDFYWYKHKLQITAYFLLCLKNKWWFDVIDEAGEIGKPPTYVKPQLPLPEICHLFSYALDDGVVRREFTWTPDATDFETVKKYAKRWNQAFASETMPECTCQEFDANPMKFCYYVTEQMTTKTGAKLGTACCNASLGADL